MTNDPVVASDQFGVILLASDGSDYSAGTERVGQEMALRHGSQLFLLRLLTSEPGSTEAAAEEQEVNAHLERFQALCAERGIPCTPLLRSSEGDIPQAILDAAKEVGAQLLVVGRRGKRGLARLMVGDATAKVLDRAECPVLVVPRLVSAWNEGVLLVLEDHMEPEHDIVAEAAFALARAASLPLTVLLVTEADEKEAELRESYQAVNRLVARAKLQEVDAEGMVQSGDIDELILEVARQRAVDLIVCEPRDRSMMERLFNQNNILTLIGQAHCPVMVVK